MPHLSPIDQHGEMRQSRRLLSVVIAVCVLVAAILIVPIFVLQGASDTEYTQKDLLGQRLGEAHDELTMLIISLVVVVQVIATFKFLRWLPYRPLILCSFGAVTLSAFCTVAESVVFPEVLNYIEHLLFMAASILLAVWCGLWAFSSKQKEGL